jgi:UDP-glucose 4-epimerase
MNKKMQRILIIGACGQIGSELTLELRKRYGNENVIAADLRNNPPSSVASTGVFEIIDVMNKNQLREIITKHKIDSIFHLAAILSAVGEKDPALC